MIADNDPTVIELLQTDLTLEGHQVIAKAYDCASAVAACAKHRPDVLIVDYRMPPGPNGLETTKRVRAANTVGAVLLYTNYRSKDLEAQARQHDAILVSKGPLRFLRETLARVAVRRAAD